jgi:hypothetical protein
MSTSWVEENGNDEEENYQLEQEYEEEVGQPVYIHNNNSGHTQLFC